MSSSKKRGRKESDHSEEDFEDGDDFEDEQAPSKSSKPIAKKKKVETKSETSEDESSAPSPKTKPSQQQAAGKARTTRGNASDPIKTELSKILNDLWKKDIHAIFHEPVPQDVPTYYEIITHPMDLTTMRGKITAGQYPDIKTFKVDLDLMWSNAKKFNEKDSIFYTEAVRLQKIANDMISRNSQLSNQTQNQHVKSKSSAENVQKSRGGVGSGSGGVGGVGAEKKQQQTPTVAVIGGVGGDSDESGNAERVKLLKTELIKTWNEITGADQHGLFACPVTEDIAPKYFQFVKRPMDLSTIKKKISALGYNSASGFQADVDLMFKNAHLYNEPTCPMFPEILRIEDFANKAVQDLIGRLKIIDSSLISGTPSSRSTSEKRTPKQKEDPETQKRNEAFLQIIEQIKQDDANSIFHEPVASTVPTYFDKIKHPMDLSTMVCKLKAGQYKNHVELLADFDLMFNNAKIFNSKETIFHKEALRLQQMATQCVREYMAENAGHLSTPSKLIGAKAPKKELALQMAATTSPQVQKQAEVSGQPQDTTPPEPKPKRVLPLQFALSKIVTQELLPLDENLLLNLFEDDPDALCWSLLQKNISEGRYKTFSMFMDAFQHMCQSAISTHPSDSEIHSTAQKVLEIGTQKLQILKTKVSKKPQKNNNTEISGVSGGGGSDRSGDRGGAGGSGTSGDRSGTTPPPLPPSMDNNGNGGGASGSGSGGQSKNGEKQKESILKEPPQQDWLQNRLSVLKNMKISNFVRPTFLEHLKTKKRMETQNQQSESVPQAVDPASLVLPSHIHSLLSKTENLSRVVRLSANFNPSQQQQEVSTTFRHSTLDSLTTLQKDLSRETGIELDLVGSVDVHLTACAQHELEKGCCYVPSTMELGCLLTKNASLLSVLNEKSKTQSILNSEDCQWIASDLAWSLSKTVLALPPKLVAPVDPNLAHKPPKQFQTISTTPKRQKRQQKISRKKSEFSDAESSSEFSDADSDENFEIQDQQDSDKITYSRNSFSREDSNFHLLLKKGAVQKIKISIGGRKISKIMNSTNQNANRKTVGRPKRKKSTNQEEENFEIDDQDRNLAFADQENSDRFYDNQQYYESSQNVNMSFSDFPMQDLAENGFFDFSTGGGQQEFMGENENGEMNYCDQGYPEDPSRQTYFWDPTLQQPDPTFQQEKEGERESNFFPQQVLEGVSYFETPQTTNVNDGGEGIMVVGQEQEQGQLDENSEYFEGELQM